MKCCVCNILPCTDERSFFPVQPKGTKEATGQERQWVCEECFNKVPEPIKELIKSYASRRYIRNHIGDYILK